MAAAQRKPETIDEYIATFPRDVQRILQEVRATIRKAAPDAQEAIKYRIPTFVLNGNLVHFAAFKDHVGFYPTPSGIEAFKRELAPYASAKGSVQFPLDAPMPLSLITKIVRFRVDEARAKAASKKSGSPRRVPKPARVRNHECRSLRHGFHFVPARGG